MIKNVIRNYPMTFTQASKKVCERGYTLYKNNDSRGKYYIAKNCKQYDGGNNTPRFFNTIAEIEEDWLMKM